MAASTWLGAVLAITLCLLLTGAAARHRHQHERYHDDGASADAELAAHMGDAQAHLLVSDGSDGHSHKHIGVRKRRSVHKGIGMADPDQHSSSLHSSDEEPDAPQWQPTSSHEGDDSEHVRRPVGDHSRHWHGPKASSKPEPGADDVDATDSSKPKQAGDTGSNDSSTDSKQADSSTDGSSGSDDKQKPADSSADQELKEALERKKKSDHQYWYGEGEDSSSSGSGSGSGDLSSQPGAGDSKPGAGGSKAGGSDGKAPEESKAPEGSKAPESKEDFQDLDGSDTIKAPGYSGYGWPTAPETPEEKAAVPAVSAGGCKAGSVVSTVMGSAVVLDNSLGVSKTPYKATSDCMGEPVNTFQYGGMCELSCAEAEDYGRLMNVMTGFTTGAEGQTVCGTLRFSSVEMKGICSVIPFSNCCEPATASSL